MFSFLNKRPNGILGLDISSTSVKMLELSRSGGIYRVESYGVESLPQNAVVEKHIKDVEGVGVVIHKLITKSRTKIKSSAVAVVGSAVITKTIDMSADLTESEIELQLQDEAEQHIPYPLDEVALDFEVQGPSSKDEQKIDVLIAACRKENVEMRVSAVELGGLAVKVVDIEAHCIQRAFGLIRDQLIAEDEADKITAIIDIGATMTILCVLSDAGALYTRDQLFGGMQLTEEIQRHYGLSIGDANLAKKQGGLPESYGLEVLQPFKNAVVRQVTRSLQFFYSSSAHSKVDNIILAGGVASIDGLADMVTAKLGIPAFVANPFVNMTLSRKVNKTDIYSDAPSLMIACGLALRNFN